MLEPGGVKLTSALRDIVTSGHIVGPTALFRSPPEDLVNCEPKKPYTKAGVLQTI